MRRAVRSIASLWALGIIVACLSVALSAGQGAPAGSANSEVLRNVDVVNMVRGGLSAEIVVLKIQGSTTRFDISDDALAVLAAAGVPEAVRAAMRASTPVPEKNESARPDQKPVEEPHKSIPLFHRSFSSGNSHFGTLRFFESGRIEWREIGDDAFKVGQRNYLAGAGSVESGKLEDEFAVSCAEIAEFGRNRMMIGAHLKVPKGNYNYQVAEANKKGEMIPTRSGNFTEVQKALNDLCRR